MQTKMFALGEVKSVEDADGDPNGEFDVILSAPTLDRDGEIIGAKVFEPLPDHITFDIDHGMSTATTVGSGVPEYMEDGRLRVKGTYSSIPRAQEVRTLVREGHIRTTSVAFMGAVREQKDGVTHIVKAELLNGAFVPIPSNRESLVLSSKSFAALSESEGISGPPVVRKAHGMSANALREAIQRALVEAHGKDDQYLWVRDYADEWVVFEIESSDVYAVYQQNYTVADGVVVLGEEPQEVVPLITYTPKSFPTAPATEAPGAGSPAPVAKALASDVVDRPTATRVEAFLLTVQD